MISTALVASAAIHAAMYFLLAACPFVLFHYRQRLFLGSMGVVAVTCYSAALASPVVGGEAHLLPCLMVILVPLVAILGFAIIMEGRSALAWAVLSYAAELFLLRFASQKDAVSRGELGIASPLSNRELSLGLAVAIAIGWYLVFLISRRRGWLSSAERYLESPRLAAGLGVRFWPARILPAVLAGLALSGASAVFLVSRPLIQPAVFALCSSLTAITAALITTRERVWRVAAFAVGVVTVRNLVSSFGLLGRSNGTLASELLAGLAIVGIVMVELRSADAGE